MKIIPVTFRAACAFVAKHHRHNDPPRGHKFSIGLEHDGELVGVVMCGRPVAAALDDGLTIEVNRTCTDGVKRPVVDRSGTVHASPANSMLYGAAWRAASAMGYERAITYTRQDESGASLIAAGWRRDEELPARKDWAESTRNPDLVAMRAHVDLFEQDRPTGNVPRIRWKRCDWVELAKRREAA